MDPWPIETVLAKVESEGLGYMIQHGVSADSIADPELARLWREAKVALDAIDAFLDQHTPDEDEPPTPTGTVEVRYASLLCDDEPQLFAGQPANEHGYPTVRSSAGGTLRLNRDAGRFGSDPEIYIEGAFTFDELLGWLEELESSVAKHIYQSLRFRDQAGEEFTVTFSRQGSNLAELRRR